MWILGGALYCEGSTDALFLAPLLRRLREDAAAQVRARVEVPDTLVLEDAPRDRVLPRDERIERAARAAQGAWGVLFIHADADGREPEAALRERVQPAVARLAGLLGARQQAVAVVPVRMTEAWLLADADALRKATGSLLDDTALGLDEALRRGPERVREPKVVLDAALVRAGPRLRPAQRAGCIARMGEEVSLPRLRHLAAFQRLETDLHAAMSHMGMLVPGGPVGGR